MQCYTLTRVFVRTQLLECRYSIRVHSTGVQVYYTSNCESVRHVVDAHAARRVAQRVLDLHHVLPAVRIAKVLSITEKQSD